MRPAPSTPRRLRVTIQGAVQGVGFRPFVYRLATELSLSGFVINDTHGVLVEVEGPEPAVQQFLERLPAERPPLASIHTLDAVWCAPAGDAAFAIRHSEGRGHKTVLVLPDIATCDDCLREVLTPTDRRWRYPFTNCTNCGPRFSIIQALPYDRPNTTMRLFTMCPACQQEYDDPTNRRFHAQPNACPVCGPQVCDSHGHDNPDDPIRHAADALRAGQIVAVKGLGGFHLMADARNAAAIALLRLRKPRRDKPFALMVRDLAQAQTLCDISPPAAALLAAPEAPIVLVPRRNDAPIVPAIAPDTATLGVMLPATPLHHLLLRELGFPVVATSGNLSDEPICTDNDEAQQRLGSIADRFLLHDRPIARHVDDSIAWVVEGEPRLLRRARGYAPLPVLVRGALPTLLGVGGHLKNTVALSVAARVGGGGKHTPVVLSQHIGDLETPEAMAAFERVIADFLRLYEATPAAIAHDLHPDYRSTHAAHRLAAEAACPLVPVQHHHAHLAACLAEQGVNEGEGPVLGVVWDGTGYGCDGTIWGGEFLLGEAAEFTRVAHLLPFRLPGGDVAVKEPRRVALALLWEGEGAAALERDDLPCIRSFSPGERNILAQMLQRGVNAPRTSSAGRLFDGVAALVGLHQTTTFEGQAAMALEHCADPTVHTAYPLDVDWQTTPALLDWRPLVVALLVDLQRGTLPAIMAAKFHNALVNAMVAVAQGVGQARVALSGGCFQNRLLTERAAQRLRGAGFQVLLHRQVPPNDGGISLGQVAVAAAHLARER